MIADVGNSVIRMIDIPLGSCQSRKTENRDPPKIKHNNNSGSVSTVAGTGTAGYLDGPSSLAQFYYPYDMCDDGFGNIYVVDQKKIIESASSTSTQILVCSGKFPRKITIPFS